MQDRFTLRFQNGEREGESVPVTPPRFSLGRRPGNTLQIQDASVSGEHAEILVGEDEVLLRDLGSTNGTRIGGRKITEGRPAHGDLITFGGINAVFQDSEFLEAPVSTPRAAAAPTPSGAETVDVVSAEMVAKSRKTSKLALIGVVVLLLAGGGAAAFFLGGAGGKRARRVEPVASVAGNKLAGYSFEGDGVPAGWSSDESAPTDFSQRGEARASGEDGLRATLAASEWALLASDPVAVSVGRSLELGAKLRARAGASARVGVEFLPQEGAEAGGSNVAWSSWISDVTLHQDVSFVAGVPPGTTRARVIVEARAEQGDEGQAGDDETLGGGSVDVDDVSLVDASAAPTAAAKVGEYALWLHGDPTGVAQLTKVSKSVLGDLHATGPVARRDMPLTAEAVAKGIRLSCSGAEALSLRVEPAAWNAGLATLGSAGLVEHPAEFEAQDVGSLLLGGGHGLVALNFESATRVSGRLEGGALRLRAELSGSVVLQVDFRGERARAGDLAFAARNAEEEGELGECLARWNELLASAPYEAKLVQEARTVRTRLEQAGLVELSDVEAAFERARFFRLVDLYRQCRSRAQVVGAKYAGSAVETQAAALVTEVEGALGELEVDLSRDEVERLKSILNVLDKTESPRLANEVRQYLRTQYGVEN